MRIRLEPLMSLARLFPSKEQRQVLANSSLGFQSSHVDWNSSQELSDALRTAKASLQSLIDHSESLWNASWPAADENKNDDNFEQWRDSILNQWGRKVIDATGVVPKGGFKAFDTSVSAQIKGAIASGKHLDRTRRLRNPVELLGGLQLEPGLHVMHFDDGEFYRTLLREIIESGESPGGALRYAKLSKQGRVTKRRGPSYTKGKRLRYNVHDKMVGFLPPVPLPDPGPLDEILANLFGKDNQLARH